MEGAGPEGVLPGGLLRLGHAAANGNGVEKGFAQRPNTGDGMGCPMAGADAARAARNGAGVAERARSVLQLTGAERLPFLDGLLTADVKGLSRGAVAYGALLNAKARVLGDLFVYDAGDGYLLDVDRALGPKVLAHLQSSRVSEAVDLQDRSADFGRLGVVGSGAASLLQDSLGIEPPTPGRWVESGERLVARTDELAVPGFDLFLPPGDSAVLRVEGGVPRYGKDMDEGTIALEAPLHRGIAFDKGCYVGQEVVARVANRGHLKRYLVGLRMESDSAPPEGSMIRTSTVEMGRVTSSVYSAYVGAALALGYVKTDFDVPGTALEIDGPVGALRARVSSLPFLPNR